MPIPPYDSQIKDLLKCLEKQTAKHEVIVCEQKIERYINKNKLLNEGFVKAKGEYIWHCDADFLPGPTLLQRMQQAMIKNKYDVIYPHYYSEFNKCWRISDGGPFLKRSVLERYGKLDESIKGCTYETFPLLEWCMDSVKFHSSDEFKIPQNTKPFVKPSHEKVDPVCYEKYKPYGQGINKRLLKEKLVPSVVYHKLGVKINRLW